MLIKANTTPLGVPQTHMSNFLLFFKNVFYLQDNIFWNCFYRLLAYPGTNLYFWALILVEVIFVKKLCCICLRNPLLKIFVVYVNQATNIKPKLSVTWKSVPIKNCLRFYFNEDKLVEKNNPCKLWVNC